MPAPRHACETVMQLFEIDVRYTKLKFVGGGAYGCVCSAEDTLTGRCVRA
jgi:hypothetical protein